MKFAFDVAYNDNKIANAVGISFKDWTDDKPYKIYRELVIGLTEYIPGEFYKRELPCIEKLLKKLDVNEIELVIIDGYVFLDETGTYGLGGHLYDRLKAKIPVVGVAKTAYGRPNRAKEIFRGDSAQPLYISSIGVGVDEACELITSMHGGHRIPTLLKRLDTLTRM